MNRMSGSEMRHLELVEVLSNDQFWKDEIAEVRAEIRLEIRAELEQLRCEYERLLMNVQAEFSKELAIRTAGQSAYLTDENHEGQSFRLV